MKRKRTPLVRAYFGASPTRNEGDFSTHSAVGGVGPAKRALTCACEVVNCRCGKHGRRPHPTGDWCMTCGRTIRK
jgi:hypothetical protein